MRTLIAIALTLGANAAIAAQAYKCTVNDAIVYQDKPCVDGGEAIKLKAGPAMSTREVQLIEMANRGRVMAGMTSDQVRIAWGHPTSVNRSVVAGTVHEQWVYRRGPGVAQYIYLEDGTVTSFQD